MSFISLFVQYLFRFCLPFQFHSDIFHRCWGIRLAAWGRWAGAPDISKYKYKYKYRYKYRHKYIYKYRQNTDINTDTNIDTNSWGIGLAAWDRWAGWRSRYRRLPACLLKAPPPLWVNLPPEARQGSQAVTSKAVSNRQLKLAGEKQAVSDEAVCCNFKSGRRSDSCSETNHHIGSGKISGQNISHFDHCSLILFQPISPTSIVLDTYIVLASPSWHILKAHFLGFTGPILHRAQFATFLSRLNANNYIF